MFNVHIVGSEKPVQIDANGHSIEPAVTLQGYRGAISPEKATEVVRFWNKPPNSDRGQLVAVIPLRSVVALVEA